MLIVDIHYKLPDEEYAPEWTLILDTSKDKAITGGDEGKIYSASNTIIAHDYSRTIFFSKLN